MEKVEFDLLVSEVGKQAATIIDTKVKEAASQIEVKTAEAAKGHMSKAEYEAAVKIVIDDLKAELKTVQDASIEQGKTLKAIEENTHQATPKSLEDILKEEITAKKDQIKAVLSTGTGTVDLNIKTAGINSLGNSILPMNPVAPNSPWLPGGMINGNGVFGIIYNRNFITEYVSMGRTNLPYLPWANEVSTEGAAAFVQEGAPKPLFNTRFQVEFSKLKKIAAMTVITEEFDADLPGFATIVKRLLTEEVARKFDDAIYAAVIAIATGYTTTGLNGLISDPNIWDAIGAGLAQIGENNYIANLVAMHPTTYWRALMTKDDQKRYNVPPFLDKVNANIVEANKVAKNYALVGDIKQYKVDMYLDQVLKVGWNNDDFQRNQFSVISEMRYHDYISSTRKNALAYYNLDTVMNQIESGS